MTLLPKFRCCIWPRTVMNAILRRIGLQFKAPGMEEEFEAKQQSALHPLMNLWCIMTFLMVLEGILVRCYRYKLFQHPGCMAFAMQFLPLIMVIGVWGITNYITAVRNHLDKFLFGASLAIIAYLVWNASIMTVWEVELQTGVVPDVWLATTGNSDAQQQLRDLIADAAIRKCMWYATFSTCLLFNFLQFAGLCWKVTFVYMSLPLSVILMVCFYPQMPTAMYELLVATVTVTVYAIWWSFYILRIQRQQFALDFTLQRSLANEAQAMQEVMERERAHKETAKHADTVLNHILKNMMADAAGCIHLFLDTLPGQTPPDLAQALSCLDSGMAWCRKRQALLQISSREYVPVPSEVNLREFGTMLVRGRPMACTFDDEVVSLDAMLCGIVLDNALSYATRYADSSSPQIQFSMRLGHFVNIPGACSRQLVLRIMYYADQNTSCLTEDLLPRLLAGECLEQLNSDTAGDQLGLQYMMEAAKAHGMGLTLEQQDQVVVLQASLEVLWHPSEPRDDCDLLDDCPSLPEGLHIVCIDDSAIACRLLTHTLKAACVNCTVHSFGQTPEEVQTFMEAAIMKADIVILDQHLDYGRVSYLGTDLLLSLKERGFSGFACIRSANVSVDNQAAYLKYGAQCAIGKDVRPQEMIRALQVAYNQFRRPKRPRLRDLRSSGSDDVSLGTSCFEQSYGSRDQLLGHSPFKPGTIRAFVPGTLPDFD